MIGEAPGGGVGGVMANLFARGGNAAHRDAFALGERGNILHHLEQAAIIPHVAESESKKAPFEVGGHPLLFVSLSNSCSWCMNEPCTRRKRTGDSGSLC